MDAPQRETKKIVTPVDKHEVELKAWLVGFEREEYEKVRLNYVQLDETGKPDITKIKVGDLIDAMTKKAIELVVVSVDGSTDKILERVMSLKEKDYLFVKDEVMKVLGESRFLGSEPIPPIGLQRQ
jgi:hypothetical protein